MTRALKTMFFLMTILALALVGGQPALALEKVSLMLDWYPNPDHVPIYVAAKEGLFAKEGLDVDIMVPADPHDPVKLLAAGQVTYAISYQPEVIVARAEGLPIVSVAALVQHPLSCILFLQASGIKTPADLKGKRIGYSIEPLYRVLVEAVAEKAGLKPKDFEMVRVGFNLVPPLLTGQVEAVAGAFRNYEAIQVELEGKSVGIFPFEKYGVPDFYELVLVTHPDEIKKNPGRVKALIRGLTAGLKKTLEAPDAAFEVFLKAHPDLRDELNRRSFKATLASFEGSPAQEPNRWTQLQTFMLERGLIKKASPLAELIWTEGP